ARRIAATAGEGSSALALLPTRQRRRASAASRRRDVERPEPAQKAARSPQANRPRPPIVELRDVTQVYPGGHVGIERVSLAVDRGEFVFIVGPTGCGKSTLIKLLTAELEPASGEVLIAGRDINSISKKQLPYLRRRIGTVFQDYKLLPNRTVYDNVAYALQVIGEPRSQIRRKVPEILRLVGLASKVHNFPDELSGGEQQRVSVARAFVNHPPLLLADEPTGNLDPVTSIGIMQLLYRINRTGTTVVVVTHDHAMVDKMRRRVVEMEDGRVVRDVEAGGYHDESTTEFGVRVSAEMGVREGHLNTNGMGQAPATRNGDPAD
ncbi:MAG: cell division ATP-binding protein FtsE, partial [Actinomycetota bacterium]